MFILVGLAPQVSKKPGILELCHVMNEDLLLSLKRESENYPRMRNCGDSTTCDGKFHVRFFPGNVVGDS